MTFRNSRGLPVFITLSSLLFSSLVVTAKSGYQPRTYIVHPSLIQRFVYLTTSSVSFASSLQEAIDAAHYGDTVVIDPSIQILGNITLRSKSGSGTIRIKTSSDLPADGTQVGRAQENQLVKIVANTSAPAIEAEADAHDYRLSGLIITNVGGNVFTDELVLIGARSSGGGIPADHKPHDIAFDQCWIREATNDTTTPDAPTTTSDRGFDISANNIAITNSRIAGFRAYKGLSATSGAESSNAILLSGTQSVSIVNTYLESWFVPLFLAPTSDSQNTASISNVSFNAASHSWSAAFSNLSNLSIDDLVAFRTTNGRTPSTNNAHSNESVAFQVGKVTSITGNTIQGISWGTFDGDLNGGNPMLQTPDSPGLAQWNGLTNQNVTVQRNQFVVNFNAAEYVWTHSGGSPTTLPRSTQQNTGNAPKSAIEIKSGSNVLIDGNTQDGWYTSFALLSPRNQGNTSTSGGVPWAGDFNISITNNYVHRMLNWDRIYSLSIGGPQLEDNEYSNVRSGHFLLKNNLLASGADMLLSSMAAADDVSVIHNTYPGSAERGNSLIFWQGALSHNFILRDNIVPFNEYGFNCMIPNVQCQSGMTEDHNVFIDNRSDNTKIDDGPLNSRFINDEISSSIASIGWTDTTIGNYRLRQDSPFKGKASDGTDPGVNIDTLLAALGGSAINPTPSPTVTPVPSPTNSPSPLPSPSISPSPQVTPTPIANGTLYEWQSFEMNDLSVDRQMSILGLSGYFHCVDVRFKLRCERVKSQSDNLRYEWQSFLETDDIDSQLSESGANGFSNCMETRFKLYCSRRLP